MRTPEERYAYRVGMHYVLKVLINRASSLAQNKQTYAYGN